VKERGLGERAAVIGEDGRFVNIRLLAFSDRGAIPHGSHSTA